ncbi:threonine/homoserine efflux transporter RhtA [Haloactinospora alba]|uniref:Threonine/homoserine efflux transporter RhtA n=1 Tax=Haloactinospora alba TaxID=405555 RepID=A0A543N9K4_9ACTN|nr:EamA family transporter [Haloactinospora alba]TQN28479.1 threonine/homoserine efflux transporter RhtA [Haloactinospora alba]
MRTDHRAAAPAPPRALTGLALALSSAVFFGSSGPAAKAAIAAGLSPLEVTWLRIAGAAVFLLPIALLTRPEALGRLVRANRWRLACYGLLSVAGIQVCYFVAVSRIPVSIALLLEFLGPTLVIAWLLVVRRVRLPGSALGGALVALAGIAVVVEVWSGLRLDPLGVAAGLGAAVCQASFFLLSDATSEEVDTLALAAGGTVIGAVFVGVLARPWNLPWHILTADAELSGFHVPVAALVVWIVLVTTVLAYVTGIAAVRVLSPPVAGTIATLEVVVAAVVAWAALGERLSAVQGLGGLVVLGGALLAQSGTVRRRPPHDAPEEGVPPVDPPS